MDINKKYTTLYEWGKAYRKIGWNVIPLYNFTKLPSLVEYKTEDFGYMPGWKIFEERMATDEEYEYWFKGLGKKVTGLGVVTGKISNLVVVDEDSYKGDGMEFEFKSLLRSKTGRGGTHHFFKYTEPIKTSGFRKGVNIEIKSDGGFAILPPTEVQIIKEEKQMGVYLWEQFCSLEELPTITEGQLVKYKGGNWQGKDSEGYDLHDLVEAGLGEQHNSLRTIALKIFARFKRDEWDIAARFVREEAKRFDPPHPSQRVEALIKDCMRYIINHRKEDIERQMDKPMFGPRSVREVADERKVEKELEKIAPSTGYPELDKIIVGFIPGHLYTLSGDTNVGKTTLACNFVERVRKQEKKVLYFALEPENTIVDYLASIRNSKAFKELVYEDYLLEDDNIAIYGKQEVRELEDLLHVVRSSPIRYDFIIVDHIGYFIRDKANQIQEQSNAIKELAWLAKEMKTAIMIIAHLRKPPARKKKDYIPTIDDIGGSGAFKQDSTEVLMVVREYLNKDPKDKRLSHQGYLIVEKTKCGPNGYIDIYFSDRHGRIMTREEVEEEVRDMREKMKILGFPDNPNPLQRYEVTPPDSDDETEKEDEKKDTDEVLIPY